MKLGGMKNIKGERYMIYKNLVFDAAPYHYDLVFDHRSDYNVMDNADILINDEI